MSGAPNFVRRNEIPKGTQLTLLCDCTSTLGTRTYPAGAVGVAVGQGYEYYEKDGVVIIDMLDGEHVRVTVDKVKARKAIRVSNLEEQVGITIDINSREFTHGFLQYRCIVGSRAFGLSSESSDYDRRGWYILPSHYYLGLVPPPQRVAQEATQEDYWELGHFVSMALAANPNILETLSSPLVERSTVLSALLLNERRRFYSKYVYQTYQGYVISQFDKLKRDLERTGEYRRKHAMHLLRLLVSGEHLLREGEVLVDVAEHRPFLESVRDGQLTLNEVNQERERLHQALTKAFIETTLPDLPDYRWANEFVRQARYLYRLNTD